MRPYKCFYCLENVNFYKHDEIVNDEQTAVQYRALEPLTLTSAGDDEQEYINKKISPETQRYANTLPGRVGDEDKQFTEQYKTLPKNMIIWDAEEGIFRSKKGEDAFRTSRPLFPVCPHCHMTLPNDADNDNELRIAIAGNTSAGKTVYFAMLYRMLTGGFPDSLYNFHIPLTKNSEMLYEGDKAFCPLNKEKSKQTYCKECKDFNNCIARHPHTPPSTSTNERVLPMAFEYTRNGKKINIILYDISGERCVQTTSNAMTFQQDLRTIARYINYCDGLIILMDPRDFPAMKNYNVGGKRITDTANTIPQVKIISSLCDALTKNGTKSFDKPLAFVLSKVDYFWNEDLVSYLKGNVSTVNASILDYEKKDGYVLRKNEITEMDNVLISKSVNDVISVLEEKRGNKTDIGTIGNILRIGKQSKIITDTSCFAVSSLGGMTEELTGRYLDKENETMQVLKDFPDPYRIDDPFNWIYDKKFCDRIPETNVSESPLISKGIFSWLFNKK